MWSAETKAGLLRHNERLIMVDALGSSEAIGMATSTMTSDGAADTASFQLGPHTRVVTDDGRDVVSGSGEIGRVAMRGHTPIGYYKDPEKSAATFQIIDGVRYSIPGDFAAVDADGTIRLLGRGSQCINTGGEKVYPEEVEEVLKLHPAVADAAVVGVPDERFGEAITALVEPHAGDTIDEAALIAHVKERLAGYKAPEADRHGPVGRAGRATASSTTRRSRRTPSRSPEPPPVPSDLVRAVMLDVPEHLLAERRRLGHDRFDEMWEGELHMVPPPSEEHQRIGARLSPRSLPLADAAGLHVRYETGLFDPTWPNDESYRQPDLMVFDESVRSRAWRRGRRAAGDRDPLARRRDAREAAVLGPRRRRRGRRHRP